MTYRTLDLDQRVETLENDVRKLQASQADLRSDRVKHLVLRLAVWGTAVAAVLLVVVAVGWSIHSCSAESAAERTRRCTVLCEACDTRLLWTDSQDYAGDMCICARRGLDAGVLSLEVHHPACH